MLRRRVRDTSEPAQWHVPDASKRGARIMRKRGRVQFLASGALQIIMLPKGGVSGHIVSPFAESGFINCNFNNVVEAPSVA